jgi:hypothetical protein
MRSSEIYFGGDGILALRAFFKAEATRRASVGVAGQLRLTPGAKEIEDLAADETTCRIGPDSRVTNGTQVLPTLGTGTGLGG